MHNLLKKLNYKGQERICIVNSHNGFVEELLKTIPSLRVDREIDPKYLYEFFLIFVEYEVDLFDTVPQSIHNLADDGVLWFAYPKKSSKNYDSDISRDKGWGLVSSHGFEPVRQVSINDDWSAIRFRHTRYIKRNKK